MQKYSYKSKFEGSLTISPNGGSSSGFKVVGNASIVELNQNEVSEYSTSLEGLINGGFLEFMPEGEAPKKAKKVKEGVSANTEELVSKAAPVAKSKKEAVDLKEAKAQLAILQGEYVSASVEEKKVIKEKVAVIKSSIKALK